ncbi:MAG: hypothetical protein P4L56_24080 [Candidatus Sulfopaludibacter sp.]|nr:hypothetical protein [Candidatus Sulfopaludibacter sp.]
MHVRASVCILGFFSLSPLPAADEIPLVVPAGAPIRVFLTKRVPKRAGAPVQARVIDPVYAFDHEVIPPGAIVTGKVGRVLPVSKTQRARAILNGDFTPLHVAPIEFTTLLMPDGRTLPIHTAEELGLDTIMPSRPAKQKANTQQNTGVLAAGKQQVHDAVQAQIARAKSIPDIVRGPDKWERIEDYLMAKLPYHPQYIRKGTRFDADLVQPLSFGAEPAASAQLAPAGTQPQADTVAHARLITPLDSAHAKPGETVEAVLAEPVFSADRKLILPEGTHLQGTVVAARKARRFHRGGQLRFTFKEIELPQEVARLESPAPDAVEQRPAQDKLKFRTQANLQAAESGGKASLKVDGEGGVQAKESKTRFLAAAASVMIARRAGDNDPLRNQGGQVIGQSQNVGGRTLGGGFGFGLLGTGIAQSSRWVGAAFGYYGMAWSLYSTVIARGSEVQFRKNAVVDIRFNPHPETAAQTQQH